MSIFSILFRLGAGKSDKKRDSIIPLPTGIVQRCNISYGQYGKNNLMDIYWPDNSAQNPVILSVHGGGYVYGNKEIYKRYCMDLARRGFTVVNINYRLAPHNKFPAPLEDINNAMLWLQNHAQKNHADMTKIFMVGDSAGAQLASQYAAMMSNSEYFSQFALHRPEPDIKFRAVGLNCGTYDLKHSSTPPRKNIMLDYLGRKISSDDSRLDVLNHITSEFPPAHVTTACHDFLRDEAKPMFDFLTDKGIPCQLDVYGDEDDLTTGHVFHINILKPEAIKCNDAQCVFFRRFL